MIGKKQYFENAVKFLQKNRYLEGGHLCAFCREQGNHKDRENKAYL